ncbi:hypothetical protein Tco_0899297, partial [Tanacetum coccineum]
PLEDGVRCQRCTCKWCGYGLREGFFWFCASRDGNSSIDDPNPNSFNDPPNVFTYPPQPQYESYSCELCGNDAHYGYDCPPRVPLVYEHKPGYDNYYPQNSSSFSQQYLNCEKCGGPHEDYQCQPWHQNYFESDPCYNLNSYGFDQPTQYSIDHQPQSIQEDLNQQRMTDVIKAVQSLVENTIPEKESDEFVKFSVEDLVPIPSESEDTSKSDCDDDESLLEEDVQEENFKIYSNPLFEFDDEYISSDVNPLFYEVLENIESKDSYVSNLDEPALLVTPLSDANEDDCFDPGGEIDEIDAFLDMDISTDIEDGYHDSEGDIIFLESLFIKDTIPNLPPDVFLDHEPRSLNNKPDNLKSLVKVFDLGIHEKTFSPTYVRLPFENRHYLSLTYVIRICLPYFTYHVDSSLPLSSGSEDIILDPGISASSLEPTISHQSETFMCFNVYLNILNESPMEICSSTRFNPNITMIWGESS